MAEVKSIRLSQVARKLNVGTHTLVMHLADQGFQIESKPNAKITEEQYRLLLKTFADAAMDKTEATELVIGQNYEPDPIVATEEILAAAEPKNVTPTELDENILPNSAPRKNPSNSNIQEGTPPAEENLPKMDPTVPQIAQRVTLKHYPPLQAPTILGKIDLPETNRRQYSPVAPSDIKSTKKKRPRKRISKKENASTQTTASRAKTAISSYSAKDIQEQIKNTLAKLSEGNKKIVTRTKHRKEKRSALDAAREGDLLQGQETGKKLTITEFISAHDLASLMDISINDVLSTCMSLGISVSINQRLDAEAITIIADEFGYQVEFIDVKKLASVEAEQDKPEELVARAPIVTIMGHVDHGKTSLLDYIRNTQMTQGEAGGITQHIGAYEVVTQQGKRVAFLDTPGHEAFTAMRARGAQLTDLVIIVVAADDGVRPQTKEAINHAQLANVPLVIAINKMDKPQANSQKVKEELAQLHILVEDWGGKYQSQEISAKTGQGVDELLEKVLLEAELLDLKANPHRSACGTVVEATLDPGRGYLATVMVQRGTLRLGDIVLAGAYYGKVKAMFNHQGELLQEVGPSVPTQILGLDGAPQAGDSFAVMHSDKKARNIARQRQQILREQGFRIKKHITLDEIGRRLAVGTFQELNIILKGDVDGSLEALADALLQLSTEEIKINIIQQSVGAIAESDILLAATTDAIVIGFQVRPYANARKLAEKEGIEIRLYDVIYDAINHVKDAMQGMLSPTLTEVITGNAVVRQVFKVSKVGTVAGCYITDGCLKKASQIRLIRDGIVIYKGTIKQLKRLKEEVQQVKAGLECGVSIEKFNDIQVEDVIEGFEQKATKRTL